MFTLSCLDVSAGLFCNIASPRPKSLQFLAVRGGTVARRSENDYVAMLFGDFPGSVRWWRLVLFGEVVKDDFGVGFGDRYRL